MEQVRRQVFRWQPLSLWKAYRQTELNGIGHRLEQRLLLYLAYGLLVGVTTFASLITLGWMRGYPVIQAFQGMYTWHTTLNFGLCFALLLEVSLRCARRTTLTVGRLWWVGLLSFALAYLGQRTLVYAGVVHYNPKLIQYYENFPSARPGFWPMLFWCGAFWLPMYAGLVEVARWLQRRLEPSAADETRPVRWSLDGGRLLIDLDQLTHLSMEDHYARVHWNAVQGQQSDLVRLTLKEAMDELPPGRYIQIHRSHLVRVDAVDALKRKGRGWVVMIGAVELPVSRHRLSSLRETLEENAIVLR